MLAWHSASRPPVAAYASTMWCPWPDSNQHDLAAT